MLESHRAKAIGKTILVGMEFAGMVNPIFGVGLAILDMTGGTDYILEHLFPEK